MGLLKGQLGLFEAGLGHPQASFGDLYARAGRTGLRLGLVAFRAEAAFGGQVDLRLEADLAGGEGGFRLHQGRLGRAHAVVRFLDLELKLGVVHVGKDCSLQDRVVDVGERLFDDARHFGADHENLTRLNDSRGADDVGHIAELDAGESKAFFGERGVL